MTEVPQEVHTSVEPVEDSAAAAAAAAEGGGASKAGSSPPKENGSGTSSPFLWFMGSLLLLIPILLLALLVGFWPRPKDDESRPSDKKASPTAQTGAAKAPQPARAAAARQPGTTPPPGKRPAKAPAQPTEAVATEPAQTDAAGTGTEPPLGTEGKSGLETEIQTAVRREIQKKSPQWEPETRILGWKLRLAPDVRLLILVLICGALGSYVHAAQSFASFVGNREFRLDWAWWYVLRIPIGASLAVFFYFLFRGGVLAAGPTPTSESNELNIFGILGFASLAGLFSKQVGDKLYDVFNTLFKSEQDQYRKDKLKTQSGAEVKPPANKPPSGSAGQTP